MEARQTYFFLTLREGYADTRRKSRECPTFCSRLFDNHACLKCALREQTIYELQYQFQLDRLQHV